MGPKSQQAKARECTSENTNLIGGFVLTSFFLIRILLFLRRHHAIHKLKVHAEIIISEISRFLRAILKEIPASKYDKKISRG